GPAVFYCDVAPLDIARFGQTLTKHSHRGRTRSGRTGAEPTNHRHRRLLRACRERPRGRGAAEQRDDLAPPHSITSSATDSSVGGTVRPSMVAVYAYLAIHFRDVSPVTHQPADCGNVAGTGCHGNRMARRHSGQLQPPTDEKSILADEQGVRRLAPKICEGGIDFAAGA